MEKRQLITITFETEGEFKAIVRVWEPGIHPGEFAVTEVRNYLKKTTGKSLDQLKDETYAGLHRMIGVEMIDLEELGYKVSFQTEQEAANEFASVSKRYNELQQENHQRYLNELFEAEEVQKKLAEVVALGGSLPAMISLGFHDEYNDEGYDRRCDEVFLYNANKDRWDDKEVEIYHDNWGEEVSFRTYLQEVINEEFDVDDLERHTSYKALIPLTIKLKEEATA